MSESKCPCCGRGCDMDHLSCPTGEEYARTGVIPAHEHHEHEHGGEGRHHGHCGHGHGGEGHHHGRHGGPHHGHGPIFLEEAGTGNVNDRLLFQFHRVGHARRILQKGRESQKQILMILAQKGPMTQRDLTERLRVQPGSASELLGKLENAGLIVRTQNETDRRTADICLTDGGRAQADEALAQYRASQEEMFSSLTDEEKATLLELLSKLTQDWEGRYPPRKDGCCPHGGHRGRED